MEISLFREAKERERWEEFYLLVTIGRGTVNMTVARGESMLDSSGHLARGTSPGAKSQQGNLGTVIELN